MLLAGYLWPFVSTAAAMFDYLHIGFLQYTILTLTVGSATLYVVSLLKKTHFRNPVTDPEMAELLEQVKKHLDVPSRIELWQRDDETYTLASSRDAFFRAVIVSTPMMKRLLNERVYGQVVLAREVLKVGKSSRVAAFLRGVLLFGFASLAANRLLSTLVSEIFLEGKMEYLPYLYDFLSPYLVLSALYLLETLRDRIDIDQNLEKIYGVDYDLALIHVMMGIPVPDDIRPSQYGNDEEESRPLPRTVRRGVIALVGTMLAGIVVGAALLFSHGEGFEILVLAPVFGIIIILALILALVAISVRYLMMLTKLMRGDSGERDTSWDVDSESARALQRLLNDQEGLEDVRVRGVSPRSDEEPSLLITRESLAGEREAVVVPTAVVRDLHDIDAIAPIVLAELKSQEIHEREISRKKYHVVVLVSLTIVSCLLMFSGSLEFFVLSLVTLFVVVPTIGIVAGKQLSSRVKDLTREADVGIADRFPKYREALRTLVEKGHMCFGDGISSRTRLRWLDDHCSGIETENSGEE